MTVSNQVLAYLWTLVWPCVVVTALILFRRQIAMLIPRIREISAAGASVWFGEQAAELADSAGGVAQQVVGAQAAAAHHLPELLPPVPAANPAVVFLEAYRELEAAARDVWPAAARCPGRRCGSPKSCAVSGTK